MLGTRMVTLKRQAGKESTGVLRGMEVQFGLSEAGWLAIQLLSKVWVPWRVLLTQRPKVPVSEPSYLVYISTGFFFFHLIMVNSPGPLQPGNSNGHSSSPCSSLMITSGLAVQYPVSKTWGKTSDKPLGHQSPWRMRKVQVQESREKGAHLNLSFGRWE